MKIQPAQGQVTLIADTPEEVEFLVAVATTFQEGGRVRAWPVVGKAAELYPEPAKAVTE